MSHTLVLVLSDDEFARLRRMAEATGLTPDEVLRRRLREDASSVAEPGAATTTLGQDIQAALQSTAAQIAAETGRRPDAVLAEIKARLRPAPRPPLGPDERQAALARLRRHCGAVRSRHPNGSDNPQIDADLAAEYGGRHDEAG